MTDPFASLRRFLRELRRRKVYRVAVLYVVVVRPFRTLLEGAHDELFTWLSDASDGAIAVQLDTPGKADVGVQLPNIRELMVLYRAIARAGGG